MIPRNLNSLRFGCHVAICTVFLTSSTHTIAQREIEVVRPGLIYGLGHVERVSRGSALIDLGDVHTLKVDERVAVIRPVKNYFVPIGVLRIEQTGPTTCRARRSNVVKPLPGDIIMFTREFWQLKTGPHFRDEYLKQQIIKTSAALGYSTFRRGDTVAALMRYQLNHPKWERADGHVIGYLEGASFGDGQRKFIEGLLKQIGMIREYHRVGGRTLPAAGEHWVNVMTVLLGPTVTAQHEAAQPVSDDEGLLEEEYGPSVRDIRRVVRERLFDRLDEELDLITYLVATLLENPVGNEHLWFIQQFGQSQFPALVRDDAIFERIRVIVRDLQGDL
ncbi:MAG: hypothetical protein GY903_11200 [Fuerstiella sp.]|nr:hypothetical protein [Fuerstiella sp.]MCP4855048.1 hypothetical protein [Fuerstiella sp.]